jgi:hypothetical protein
LRESYQTCSCVGLPRQTAAELWFLPKGLPVRVRARGLQSRLVNRFVFKNGRSADRIVDFLRREETCYGSMSIQMHPQCCGVPNRTTAYPRQWCDISGQGLARGACIIGGASSGLAAVSFLFLFPFSTSLQSRVSTPLNRIVHCESDSVVAMACNVDSDSPLHCTTSKGPTSGGDP